MNLIHSNQYRLPSTKYQVQGPLDRRLKQLLNAITCTGELPAWKANITFLEL